MADGKQKNRLNKRQAANKLGEFQNNSLINSGAKVLLFHSSAILCIRQFDELQNMGDEL